MHCNDFPHLSSSASLARSNRNERSKSPHVLYDSYSLLFICTIKQRITHLSSRADENKNDESAVRRGTNVCYQRAIVSGWGRFGPWICVHRLRSGREQNENERRNENEMKCRRSARACAIAVVCCTYGQEAGWVASEHWSEVGI